MIALLTFQKSTVFLNDVMNCKDVKKRATHVSKNSRVINKITIKNSRSACNANKRVSEINFEFKEFFVRYNFTSDATKLIRGQ